MGDDPPLTNYASPAPSWEPWCAEYRYGALYLFPPDEVRARVNALRSQHDPKSHAICDAHISLTVPFPRALTRADAAEIARVASTIEPFPIGWGPPYQYPGTCGVVLRIAPLEQLTALVSALESCACFEGAPLRRYPFSPHMTIAEFISLEHSEVLARDLEGLALQGTFACTSVAYAVPDARFRFTERHRWTLGRTSVSPHRQEAREG